MYKTINDEKEFNQILNSEILSLVEFSATWCAQCKMMMPTIVQIEEQFTNHINVVIVDADKNPEIAKEHAIISLPTFILFKAGKKIASFQMRPKSYIINLIENSL